MTPLLLALATFFAAAAGDVVEAYFVRSVADLDPHQAARMSVAMYCIGCVGWYITIRISLWYMIPEVLGLYVGSVVAIRAQRRKAQRYSTVASQDMT
jgi:cytochrome c-type biogenesis protein CcmH/NrfF